MVLHTLCSFHLRLTIKTHPASPSRGRQGYGVYPYRVFGCNPNIFEKEASALCDGDSTYVLLYEYVSTENIDGIEEATYPVAKATQFPLFIDICLVGIITQ